MNMNAIDLIGLEAIQLLHQHGFAVVHSEPTESMVKAGLSIGQYHYHAPTQYWHRMVGESIRLQQCNKKPTV